MTVHKSEKICKKTGSKKIAVATGGEIRLEEPRYLVGTCFEVRLPLKQKQALAC